MNSPHLTMCSGRDDILSPAIRIKTNVTKTRESVYSDRRHCHSHRLGSRQSELLEVSEAFRSRRGYDRLDDVCCSWIGMHPGLRWSYMQIFSVSVSKPPTKGKIVIVGPGFRYFA